MASFGLLKRLVGDSVVYGISGIITRFIAVFLIPIYTRYFTPEDYGIISLITNILTFVSILVVLGMDNSVARWYYDDEDEDDRKRSLNTFFWSCLVIAVGFAGVIAVSRHLISDLVVKEPAAATLFLIAAANLPFTIFIIFTNNVLRIQRKAVATSVFSLTVSLTVISLNIFFIAYLRTGIIGVFYAQFFSSLVAAGLTLFIFRKTLSPFYFDWQRWKEMFLFSLPLVPGSIAFWVINLSGVYFIQSIRNANEVGLYQLGTMIAAAVAMVTGAFQMAWGPFAFSIYKQPHAREFYAKVLVLFLAITCFIGYTVTIFAKEVLMIVATPGFYGADRVAGILSFNYVVISLGYIASIGTGIAKNNWMYGVASLVSAGLIVILNLNLIPIWGKEGAALSTLIAQMVVPVAIFWHAQRLYPIPYNFKKAAMIFFTSLFGSFGVLWILQKAEFGISLGIAVKLLASIIFGVGLFLVLRKDIHSTRLLTHEFEGAG